jgi:hypothetical protein
MNMNEKQRLDEMAVRIVGMSKALVLDVLKTITNALKTAKDRVDNAHNDVYSRGIVKGLDIAIAMIESSIMTTDKAADDLRSKVEDAFCRNKIEDKLQ